MSAVAILTPAPWTDDTTEVSKDAWGFWGVPKERQWPGVSFGS
jgi:hypothetical protein